MKREGMPTQRLEEKRVEEHMGEVGGERERAHAHGRGRESALWLLLFASWA